MIGWKGKDHRTSLAERERFIEELRLCRPSSYVWLQTCNRVELYYGDGQTPENVARHLFRVSAGLESKILGETPIQHQVKKAYLESVQENRCSSGLHMLFQAALRTGKRIRSETNLSTGATNHGRMAVQCIRELRPNLQETNILVVGATCMARGIIRRLKEMGASSLYVANRTFARALVLAVECHVHALKLEEAMEFLPKADILVAATSSPVPPFSFEMFPRNKSMLVLDLGVPRNVEERVGKIDGVTLLNIEDLEKQLHQNFKKRQGDIEEATNIIEEELSCFMERRGSNSVPARV